MTFPYAGKDRRAGVVHQSADGLWRAQNWSGPLGAFPRAHEAEEAIRQAPKAPKMKRQKLPPREDHLTSRDIGFPVYEGRSIIGGVIRSQCGLYAASTRAGSVSHHKTAAEAATAVRTMAAREKRDRRKRKGGAP